MAEFLNTLQTQNVPLFTLAIVIIIAVTIIFFLGALSLKFFYKIRDLSKQRFGFGGKPIFSLLVFVMIAVAIPLTLYASYQSVDIINYARAEKDVFVEITTKAIGPDLYEVAFSAVPFVEGQAWVGKDYDITWTIEGETSFSKVEKKRNSKNISYFRKDLPSGDYTVEVIVESDMFSVRKEQELVLE